MASKTDRTLFDEMTTEELCQFLRDDAERGDDQIDGEQLLQIMEVIVRRRKKEIWGADSKKSGEIFKKYYLSENVPPPVQTPKQRRWKHGLVAAVAALAILVGGLTIPAVRSKSNMQNSVRWTRDHFWFEGPQENAGTDSTFPTATGERVVWKELHDVLAEHSLTFVPLPNWMPEGYELCEVRVVEEGDDLHIFSTHLAGNDLLDFSVQTYHPGAKGTYYKDPGPVELYQYNGIDFYIISNMDFLTAAWIQGGYECNLSGHLTNEEMIQMIESMTIG